MEAMILSYGLDTNGQNQRFVQASRKFGRDPAILSAMAIGNVDPGGVVARFQMAADTIGGLEIRSAHRAEQYFKFPNDILWTRHTEPEIRRLADRADVIHLNNSHMALKRFRLHKPALLHHHGSLFRNDPQAMFDIARQYRMVQAVSTPDLLQYGPDQLTWLPTAYNIDALAEYGAGNKREPDGRIRIVHSPTNRALKHTAVLERAVAELQAEGLPLDLVMVENLTWDKAMAIKATADVVYDQLLFGYGCNSVEAWAMGIPVISGSDDWTRAWMVEQWGQTPYEDATPDSLKEKVRQLIDPQYRAMLAERGMAHVRTYHDERPALATLAELYVKAIDRYAKPARIEGKGVTFRSRTGRTLTDFGSGETITFTDHTAEVNDADVIRYLRTLSKRTAFGIEEIA